MKLRSFRQPPVVSFSRRSSFLLEEVLSCVLILDLTFHDQWHTCRVRCQPPFSDSFACLKKPSWSCQIALVPLLKLYWHGAENVLPSCAGPSAHLSTDLYSTGGCARTTTLGQLPWSKRILNSGGAEQNSAAAKI